MTVKRELVVRAVRMLLEAVGENPDREGLRETPERVARMLEELLSGYSVAVEPVLFTEESDLVVLSGIEFASLCEHHLLPFVGVAHVAYVPRNKVIGVSKIARIVRKYSSRLQLQERLTRQVAEEVAKATGSRDVLVVTEAVHTCMLIRGVRSGATVTSVYGLGRFKEASMVNQVLSIIQPYRLRFKPFLLSS